MINSHSTTARLIAVVDLWMSRMRGITDKISSQLPRHHYTAVFGGVIKTIDNVSDNSKNSKKDKTSQTQPKLSKQLDCSTVSTSAKLLGPPYILFGRQWTKVHVQFYSVVQLLAVYNNPTVSQAPRYFILGILRQTPRGRVSPLTMNLEERCQLSRSEWCPSCKPFSEFMQFSGGL